MNNFITERYGNLVEEDEIIEFDHQDEDWDQGAVVENDAGARIQGNLYRQWMVDQFCQG